MENAAIEVRSASAQEVEATVACITAAFVTDPIARFCWPSVHAHLLYMPTFTRDFGGAGFEHGTAHVSDDLCGAALWLPPGVHGNGAAVESLMRETTHPPHLDDLLGTMERMERFHPDEPHWYLPLIGVEPNAQGRGLGAALLRHALERFDREGALAYLESSNPRNIPLYERHGFEIVGEIRVGAAPVMTPMLRRPR
jgi:GNAT superfamily N-acetyltransferase